MELCRIIIALSFCLAACGSAGGAPSATQSSADAGVTRDADALVDAAETSADAAAAADAPTDAATRTQTTISVVDHNETRLDDYPIDGKGNVSPIRSLSYTTFINDVAYDKDGYLYVADYLPAYGFHGGGVVVFYPDSKNGDAPAAKMGGDANSPPFFYYAIAGMAIAPDGKLATTDIHDASGTVVPRVLVFSISGHNTLTLVHQISGSTKTKLVGQQRVPMTFDAKGNLYVTTPDGFIAFAPDAEGDTWPIRYVTGRRQPSSIAVDSQGLVYLSVDFDGIEIFATNAFSNAEPMAKIAGPSTQMSQARAIALDSMDYLYVLNPDTNARRLLVFPPGAHDDAAPTRVIEGPGTNLENSATSLVVH